MIAPHPRVGNINFRPSYNFSGGEGARTLEARLVANMLAVTSAFRGRSAGLALAALILRVEAAGRCAVLLRPRVCV
jgi:hypothetical protein